MKLPDTSTEQGQREASVMLARVMGWHIGNKKTERGAWIRVLCDDHGNDLGLRPPFGGGVAPKHQELVPSGLLNLYNPANMALATKVYEWWYVGSVECDVKTGGTLHITDRFYSWLKGNMTPYKWDWFYQGLNEIITLSLEAGMIEAQP